uniref:ATP-binding cassette transporter subfamily C member 1 X3 protein n=1 Tax=Brachionus koreanus TaxID=1199090 RepID=A0A1J0MMX9_9BILA|nr:ATP-binding cassette transporter subfamily C member 1 X3 protein [Brachionus koreanus]
MSFRFCSSSFWNSSLLFTSNPDFSDCFRKTVLTWAPCFILFLYSPIAIYMSFGSPNTNSKSNKKFYFSKMVTNKDIIRFWLSILSFILIISIWTLSFFSEFEKNIDSKTYPESNSSQLSWLTFGWISKLIYIGYKKSIDQNHVWKLDDENDTEVLGQELENEWQKSIKRNNYKKSFSFFNLFKKTKIHDELEMSGSKDTDKKNKPSISLCLIKIHLKNIISVTILILTHDLLDVTGPLILDGLINFISDDRYSKTIGLFLSFLIFFRLIVMSFCLQHSFYYAFLAGVRTRSALMRLIYKKSLKLSPDSKKKATTGEILNLMQVNTQIFIDLSQYGHQVWTAPVKIIVSSILLWNYIGPAVFAGLFLMIILVPLNTVFTSQYLKSEREKLKFKDSRMKILNEVLNGIRVIKFYGWEISFEKMINKIRNSELKILKKASLLFSALNFTMGFTSFMITFISLLTFIYIDDKNLLTPNVAYVTLSLFNTIKIPLFLFSPAISTLLQTLVALRRIQNFLLLEETQTDQISYIKHDEHAVVFEKASFSWGKQSNQEILKNIDCKIPHKKLVAVVGKVGTGKSSFLFSILGEMYKLEGKLNIDGSISYVPQQAWIQNASVRENIVFGNKFDYKYYNSVIQACSLQTDLDILVAGDKTEIGEKGINLSGGQKQRISLARAIYNNSDIFLFDDPLSAVDAHVGKHIFENVMGTNGLLKNKTRILVTNSINFLPQTDLIFMFENGKIVESGNYNELINLNGCFTRFVNNNSFVNNTEKEKEENKGEFVQKPVKEESEIKQNFDENVKNSKIIEQEKIESGNLKARTIYEYFKASSFLITFLFLFGYLVMNVFYALSSFWLSEWTNANIEPSGDKLDKGFRILVFALLGFSQYIFFLFAEVISVLMILNSSRNLHQNMLVSVMHSTMQFFESTPIGRILNRFSKDIINLEYTIPVAFKDFTFCMLDTITSIIAISISTPFFLTVFVPTFFVYLMIQRFYVASSSQLKRLDATTRSPIYSHFGESLNGISSIKAYKAQSRFINLIEQKINDNNSFFYPSLVATSISPGIIGLSITFAMNISMNLSFAVKCSSDLESNLTSVERIKEYCETPQEADWKNKNYQPDDKWPENGEINFVNYSVKYRQDLDYALKNINCHIKSSEKIGIVGRTGAGKSSLSLALFRLLESNDGEILIDGMNIKRMGLHDLRQKLTIIPQDPATAAIDHNTDDLVQDTIRTAFSHCTMITIAHRLNTILDSDRIMVLDKGKIVEFDTPHNLLSDKDGLFYSLAKAANFLND